MPKRKGMRTLEFTNRPVITAGAGAGGRKESEGPLRDEFDLLFTDSTLGEKTWEKAESSMHRAVVERALQKSGKALSDVDYIFAGDLLDQCIGSTFGLRELAIPFFGLYGACSTMALALTAAGLFVDSGAAKTCVASTSSHFCSAEKQFRFPLEYGSQRTPSAQWTVTGAGAAVVEAIGSGVHIDMATLGRITDLGITDTNNMGAAMAPAAYDTISAFFKDTGYSPKDLDMILTGDLGLVGSRLLSQLFFNEEGINIRGKHEDCGLMIFDLKKQSVNAGGSGCGCSAGVLCSHILKKMNAKQLKKVLFVATGALMSPLSSMQGESIPSIAHAVLLTSD